MKKLVFMMILMCALLVGCGSSDNSAVTVEPLPSTINSESLTDAVLSVSLEEGNAYVDDEGVMQMDVTIYDYNKYDMVDIAGLKEGDIIVTNSGDVEIASLEEDAGVIHVNGGLEEGGFDLTTDDSGVYYEIGFDDAKNWYEVKKATIRVSSDFEFRDNSDMEKGEVIFFPGSFLIGEVTNYDFTPYNTTIRVEAGQIVEMNRRYMP